MKKLYIFTLALFGIYSAQAQNSFHPLKTAGKVEYTFPNQGNAASATPSDTLGLDEFTAPYAVYSTGSGYLFGTDGIDTVINGTPFSQKNSAVAQGYVVSLSGGASYSIEGAMILFGVKYNSPSNPNAKVKVSVNKIAPNRALANQNSVALDAPGPSATALASVDLPMSDINVGVSSIVPTFVNFASPVTSNSDFAVVVNFSSLIPTTDTVAFVTDAPTSASGQNYAFMELTINGTIKLYAVAAGATQPAFDGHIGLFPLVSTFVGVTEGAEFFEGIKLGQNSPNPFASTSIINYELQNSADDVKFQVYDSTGRLAFELNEGNQLAGKHSISIGSTKFSPGVYYYSLTANGKRLTKKMTILE